MKLFLTWLLGVPVLVVVMVLARAMSPQGFGNGFTAQAGTPAASGGCLREQQLHDVAPLVTQQGKRVPCNGRSVE